MTRLDRITPYIQAEKEAIVSINLQATLYQPYLFKIFPLCDNHALQDARITLRIVVEHPLTNSPKTYL